MGERFEELVFVFKGQELRDRMRERTAKHEQKAAQWHEDIPKLREIAKRTALQPSHSEQAILTNYSNSGRESVDDIISGLEDRIRDRQKKAGRLHYLAQHLIGDATYNLNINELQSIEVV